MPSGFSAGLILRPFTLHDAKKVAELVGDRNVSRWTSNIPHPYTVEDAINWIQQSSAHGQRCPYAVELSGELVACVSYWPHQPGGFEVGYWVGRPYWKRGIATRALSALLQHDDFPQSGPVHARVMSANLASQRVLLKCGFEFIEAGIIEKNGENIPAKFYVRTMQRSM